MIKKPQLPCKSFVNTKVSLANDLHTPYSTLYSSTVQLLAKWTIANGFQQAPRTAFLAREKSSLVLKIDGISTEPDTWKGLENIANQRPQLAGFALGVESIAAPVKEVFQSGTFELRGMSCRSGFTTAFASIPL